MSLRLFAVAAAACAMFAGALPAHAQGKRHAPQYSEPVNGRIETGKAYILYRGPTTRLTLLRAPLEADREAYRAERAKALKDAQARANMVARLKPLVITDATLVHPPIEMRMRVELQPSDFLTGPDGEELLLVAVQPGNYTVYGAIGWGEFGFGGRCLCMGTVSFEARAGQITDMGRVLIVEPDDLPREGEPQFPGRRSMTIVPATAPVRMPAPFEDATVAPAEYRAADKIPNFLKIDIDRLTPMPGVLGYERDKVIDLRATGSAAN
ncbi:hypothetical protein [Sphingomonas sp. G-3-2-10]|uniref:hypothetical protein n=1 Tax=Sphingomonas sp. G-3-2-10 TaxID=2728838 RepID=UPI00146E548A|nr:hypothetical protein [Sphingomonas sp. G-3-2-10]NML04515.1 hypothetical protein [Sphingomonas sp. G-3-2-10]